ncbi:MAG: RNA polymerase sigma factor [Myxococcota bacterium]
MHLVRPSSLPSPPEPREDELGELVEATLKGDRGAARELFDAVAPIFLRAARSTLGAKHPEVEDFVQDASLRFFRSLEGFRGESRIRRYAYRIGCNVAVDWIRTTTSKKRARIDVEIPEHLSSNDNPAAELHRQRIIELLADTLPKEQLRTFVLWSALGCSISEIADETGVPRNTVRSRLRLAKETLRRKLTSNPALFTRWENTR